MGSIGAGNSAIQLPVIGISDFTVEVGKKVLEAATTFGFLYIDTNGTGFTESIVDREFAFSRQFFALPEAEKEPCRIDNTNRGWTGMHGEILDPKTQRKGDFKQAFNIGAFLDGKPQQPLPKFLESRIDELAEFERTCKQVCDRVLDLLGLGLEVEEPNFFSSRHTQPSGFDVRAGAHSDYGSITLLFQRPSQPGLQIRTPEDAWAPVPVIPDGYHSTTFPPVLVNIADLLSYWTNGILKSTVHRVIFPQDARRGGEDRYSIAYFSHPGDDVELTPVPSKLVEQHKLDEDKEVGYGGGATSKRAMTAKDHLLSRLNATYGFRGAQAKEIDSTA
ncbi:uncharacterized protein A1O5_01835 [Cladophialophora psammophila CBS 110553]|uniref:Fe2OG dioxygenase domain-containing protein n=1 Tax=Cladophialophora psammophila CBS 110553 TaxID=1182543 RepID=W9XXY2_9EURO|nr:uncharacterized protein A1O5_01835 [Cladophialophora psammophila CBS 110553]EXJ75139.1 hypothetical protein A1O5_01835 [Cladophialophora psammophila CBS 110553]